MKLTKEERESLRYRAASRQRTSADETLALLDALDESEREVERLRGILRRLLSRPGADGSYDDLCAAFKEAEEAVKTTTREVET